ncbi:MAG: YihY/virulence factor BrkB family protein [Holophaga sp.]|nr:YihY/virulence factor BrkB family protein [Holophaga sp.]
MFQEARARITRAQRAFRHVTLLGWRRFAVAFPRLGRAVDFSWEVLKKYYKDDCFSYAAGLSFWLIISLVPMSTLLFKMLGLILGTGAYTVPTQGVLETIVPFLPPGFVEDSIRNSQQVGGLGLSLPVLLFGSYWGIGQLDTSLAHVFGLRIKKHRQTRKNPLFRQITFLVGGMIILVLFIALLVGGAISRHLPFRQMDFLPYLPPILCLFLLTVLLQHLPRLHVKWRHAFLGALISTTLWWLAKWGFAVYLKHTFTWGIMYGSMLSMVAGLTFLYYSSAIFLLGAEITAAFYRHESGTTARLRIPDYLREPKP